MHCYIKRKRQVKLRIAHHGCLVSILVKRTLVYSLMWKSLSSMFIIYKHERHIIIVCENSLVDIKHLKHTQGALSDWSCKEQLLIFVFFSFNIWSIYNNCFSQSSFSIKFDVKIKASHPPRLKNSARTILKLTQTFNLDWP